MVGIGIYRPIYLLYMVMVVKCGSVGKCDFDQAPGDKSSYRNQFPRNSPISGEKCSPKKIVNIVIIIKFKKKNTHLP